MSEPLEKQLIDAFATAWGEAVPNILGCSSTLTLVTQQEVIGESVQPALAAARGYPVTFAVPCFGELSGILLCLFKKEDCEEVQQFMFNVRGSAMKSVVSAAVEVAATALQSVASAPITFGEVTHIDLAEASSAPAAHLAKVVGEWAWVNTFRLDISESLITEMVLLYAPQGTIEALTGAAPLKQAAPAAPASVATPAPEMVAPLTASGMIDIPNLRGPEMTAPLTASAMSAAATSGMNIVTSATKGRSASPPLDDAGRNMERLLDVELEVVVRFGLTHIPLRELVRIGVGSMIELNRQVDEPVELLVNNRPLARGSVVVVDGYYGVCITEIGQLEERRLSLTKPS